MALPFALVTLARQLGTLPPDDRVTLWWPTQGLPRWIPPTPLPNESGEAWTYPDVATAFAVVWYCCVVNDPGLKAGACGAVSATSDLSDCLDSVLGSGPGSSL